MIVKDLMTTMVTTVLPSDKIETIAHLMSTENIGTIPVCDARGHVLGIITDRDLVLRYNLGNTAEDIMTPSPVCISPETDIHEAALTLAKNKILRLLVLDNEKLVGILTLKDFSKKKIFIPEIGHIIYSINNPQES